MIHPVRTIEAKGRMIESSARTSSTGTIAEAGSEESKFFHDAGNQIRRLARHGRLTVWIRPSLGPSSQLHFWTIPNWTLTSFYFTGEEFGVEIHRRAEFDWRAFLELN
jgi:hypothetical protein